MDSQQLFTLLQTISEQNAKIIAICARLNPTETTNKTHVSSVSFSPSVSSVPPATTFCPRKKTVPSHTDPSVSYTVTTFPWGKTCTCPHFIYRKKACKHM